MKKQVLLLLAVLLAVGMIGIGAQAARAETTYTEGTLYYIVQNDSVTITGCFSRNAEVRVPAMIAGYPVNTIATGAFASNTNVKTVYLPDTITHIQSGAFGDWIHIVYNANTDHPQDVPSDLILENWDTDPSAQPSATATQAGQTQQPDTTPQQGTGSLDGDTTPKPTQTAGTATEKATSTATVPAITANMSIRHPPL